MQDLEKISQQHPIVLFDGVCVFCNVWIDRLMRWDKHQRFRLLPLQSELAKKTWLQGFTQHSTVAENPVPNPAGAEQGSPAAQPLPNSVQLYYQGKWYSESTAVLKIALLLGFPFSLLAMGFLFPPFVRNGIYRLIARNRYNWWGKKNSCRVPTAAEEKWFLRD
ncbi:MAG: DUF393 domain-containing protein [Sphingobacteriia bacterium]|nr:MAG: DUF393 domain-containing protein [Sphingobacteriia bacterium]